MGIIYLWTNKTTNKHYVGQTINPDQRKRNHIHEAFTRGSDYYFHRSLRKHGLDAFTYEVLEEDIEKEQLNDRENHYIEKYNSIWPNGYNQCLANFMSQESIEKMKATKRKRWELKPEDEKQILREHMRKIATGRPQSQKQKEAVSKANQKEWIVTHPDGKTERLTNLRQFCIDKGLGTNGQSNLTRGSYKGYKATKI